MIQFMERIPDYREEWRKVNIFIPYIKDYYWISNKGRVYTDKMKRYMNLTQDHEFDYLVVKLRTIYGTEKKFRVHRLVMMCFNPIPNPQLYQVNHITGVKSINEIPVLEWCTSSENNKHAFKIGLKKRKFGEDSNNSVYDEKTIQLICVGLSQNLPFDRICTELLNKPYTDKLSSLISCIKRKQIWCHISCTYNIDNRNIYTQKFTDQQALFILELYKSTPDMTYDEIIVKLGIDLNNITFKERKYLINTIWRIKTRKSYKHL